MRRLQKKTRRIVKWIPCADCEDCIPIGDGDGLCDYFDDIKKKKIVELFDIEAECPKRRKEKHG
jgi:hypothetical protein